MKAIVVGMGSMGKRRTRLLKELKPGIKIIGIDLQESRRKEAEKELGIMTGISIKEACHVDAYDIAFISTSPLSHASIISECLDSNLHVFTELNLVSKNYDENVELAREKGKILFLSSTFLYRNEIQYVKRVVEESKCRLSYMYHAGQYLPDWHPWEDYKNFFVGDKRTNGCREFMAIELPWLVDTFGGIISLKTIKSKDSSLDIDFPDTYQIMLEHTSGHKGLITIDIVSRKPVRRFELSGEDLYLTWDGTPDSVFRYDFEKKKDMNISLYDAFENKEGYSSFIIENAYKSEIENFLNVVEGKETPRYSFEKDKEILSIIDKIEESEGF